MPSTSYICEFPPGTSEFAVITPGYMKNAAKNIYKKVAVGSFYEDLRPSESKAFDKMFYYGSLIQPYTINFNGGKQQIKDLSDIPIDFAQFQWLAQHIKPGTYGDGYKVFVVTNGKAEGGCYSTYDFIPGGQGENEGKTLVVFNTHDDICLSKTQDGRQFGPTVIAPYSTVTLKVSAIAEKYMQNESTENSVCTT